MNKINILGITNGNNSGVAYFRMQIPLFHLYQNHIDKFNIICLASDNINLSAKELSTINICHFHANVSNDTKLMSVLYEMQKNGCKLIMDCDDYFDVPKSNPYHKYYNENLTKPIITNLKRVDAVTTTTKLFKDELKKYTNKKIYVFPNVIDKSIEQFNQPITKFNKLRIGVVCGASHQADIELLEGLVKGLKKHSDKIQWSVNGFDVRGNSHPELSVWNVFEQVFTDDYKSIPEDYKEYLLRYDPIDYPMVESMPYRRYWAKDIHSYGELYKNIDVLLAPLENTKFNCMKSELKIIEASNFGKVFIGSSVGIYKEIITNGFDGLLIKPQDGVNGWVNAIKNIIDNPDLYKILQANCSLLSRNKYNIDRWCNKRIEFYQSLIKK